MEWLAHVYNVPVHCLRVEERLFRRRSEQFVTIIPAYEIESFFDQNNGNN